MWWVCHWVTAKRLLMYTMYISINKVSLPTQNVKSKLGYFFSTCMMSIGVTDDDYIYTQLKENRSCKSLFGFLGFPHAAHTF
jgi:hypothetical protein